MRLQIIQDERGYRAALGRVDGYLLILGESGFECYLTCPVFEMKAGLRAVSLLMHDLEALSWHGRLHAGPMDKVSTAGYEAHMECGEFMPGDAVERGEITAGLWLSPMLSKFGIADQARDVLRGAQWRIEKTPAMADCQEC